MSAASLFNSFWGKELFRLTQSEYGCARAAVGNQSGTVKMTLLCGTPTFIFGHEVHRHTVTENW
ncbi:hypothetical protein CSA37_01500, partial [Candidatus Fermentibacteria bacterium]